MTDCKTGFRADLHADLKACGLKKLGGLRIALAFLTTPTCSALVVFRAARACMARAKVKGGKLWSRLAWILWRTNCALNSCDISVYAEIGGGFSLPHPAGVVIGVCRIGRDVTVFQNVTLGLLYPDPQSENENPNLYPIIGDGARLYAGAVVLGPVHIGARASVGANAVVLTNVPDGAVAVGVPARVIEKKVH